MVECESRRLCRSDVLSKMYPCEKPAVRFTKAGAFCETCWSALRSRAVREYEDLGTPEMQPLDLSGIMDPEADDGK